MFNSERRSGAQDHYHPMRNKDVSLYFQKTLVRPRHWFMWRAGVRGPWERKGAFQYFFPHFLPLHLPTCEVSLCYRTSRPDCQGSGEPLGSMEKRAGWRVETVEGFNVKKTQDFSTKKWIVDDECQCDLPKVAHFLDLLFRLIQPLLRALFSVRCCLVWCYLPWGDNTRSRVFKPWKPDIFSSKCP